MTFRPLPLADLRADCSRCAGLCCVAPPFARSTDFAFDKPAGTPCHHLGSDFRCGIHEQLRDRGMPGCTVFDCFGAGQRVVQQTFGGRTWRDEPELARQQFEALGVVHQLHEMLVHLTEALTLEAAAPLHDDVRSAYARTDGLAAGTADELTAVDVPAIRREVGALLQAVSELARPDGRDRRGADLVGRDLRGHDLRDAGLRGALLIGADLRGADIRGANLLGADLRGCDVRGTDLSTCLFLTQPQVSAARGDARTRIPAVLTRPPNWDR